MSNGGCILGQPGRDFHPYTLFENCLHRQFHHGIPKGAIPLARVEQRSNTLLSLLHTLNASLQGSRIFDVKCRHIRANLFIQTHQYLSRTAFNEGIDP